MRVTEPISRDFEKLLTILSSSPTRIDKLSDKDLSKLLRILKYRIRRKCKKDLYFLCKYVIGFKDMVYRFHYPICKRVQNSNRYIVRRKALRFIPRKFRRRLWLLFRGSFKTSIITIGHSIQLLLLDVNLRICLANYKLANAEEMLTIIKNVFMYNDLFRFLFPEYCLQPNREGKIEWGTKSCITLPNRTDKTLKEGSIECAGVDTGLTSRHYDVMKKDDLVTEKSVTTEDQIQASIDWDRLSISLLDSPGRGFFDWIGTIYDDRDLYCHLLKRTEKKLLRHVVKLEDESGHSVLPERISDIEKEHIKEEQGDYIYSCQYMLEPVALKDRKFKPEWFTNYWDELPKFFAVCIYVDPANARKKTAKYTAMIVHAVDGSKNWYLIDGVFDKLSPTQRVEALFGLVRKWYSYLRLVSYETIGFQESDRIFIERKMHDENIFFRIESIEAQDKTKLGRIEGLVPFYEYKKIFLPRELKYFSKYHGRMIDIVEMLKYEALRFPKSEHLDLLDAQSQQLRYVHVYPLLKKEEKKMVPGSFDWYRMKIKKYNKNPKKRYYELDEVWDKIVV